MSSRLLARVTRVLSTTARSPWLRAAFLLAAVTLAGIAIIDQRNAVIEALSRVAASHLTLATAATVGNLALAAVAWRAVITGLGTRLGMSAAGRIYLLGQVGKYLPGGVWNLLAAAELGHDHGIARRQTVSSMLLAVLISSATAAALALATLVGSGLALLSVLPLLALHPRVLNTLIAGVLRMTRREPLPGELSARGSGIAASWTLASWLAIGLQVFALAVAVGAPPTLATLATSTGAYVLAWLAGTAAVVLPAGAGAREAALVLVLAPLSGSGPRSWSHCCPAC